MHYRLRLIERRENIMKTIIMMTSVQIDSQVRENAPKSRTCPIGLHYAYALSYPTGTVVINIVTIHNRFVSNYLVAIEVFYAFTTLQMVHYTVLICVLRG